jgi:hypothetical protein
VCPLQHTVAFAGFVSTIEVEQQSFESVEVVVAATLERLNEVVQVFLADGVKREIKDEMSCHPVELAATVLDARRNARAASAETR